MRKPIEIGKIRLVVLLVFIASWILLQGDIVCAASATGKVKGRLYEFDEKNEYTYSNANAKSTINEGSLLGTFSLNGEIKIIPNYNGFEAFEVKNGTVDFRYYIKSDLLNSDETEWHVVDDKSSKIDALKLDEKIMGGAIVVQASLDNNKWINEYVCYNISGSDFMPQFYSSSSVQQVNGCYYRIIVAYKTEKRLPDTKGLFGITEKHFDYKKYVEVYEFYMIDSRERSEKVVKATDEPRIIVGDLNNTKKVKKDTGYAEEETMTAKDPHYGWNLGTFYINGFTRDKEEDGTHVFLKNLGDTVTLWYRLEQKDINCLNEKKNLSIAGDGKGYDQAFPDTPKTDFKRGALFIRYTDRWNNTTTTRYFNYLEANTKTGTDTKVELFEEGDYYVSLDYCIKDSSGIDSYTYYRLSFSFKIRNGNCMFYIFDKGTGNELPENALAEKGIRIDLAKSKYLDIDVTKTVIDSSNVRKMQDVRLNRPDRDGAEYTDEGVYVFTITNRATNEKTTKKYYVGTDPYIKALAVTGLSLNEIEDRIEEGYTIAENGTLIPPPEPEETEEETAVNETIQVITEEFSSEVIMENEEDTYEKNEEGGITEPETEMVKEGSSGILWFVVVGSIIFSGIGLGCAYFLKIRKEKGGTGNEEI